MNLEQVTVRSTEGDYTCPGAPTPVPGLFVVHDTISPAAPFYSVNHTSGIAAGLMFADAESALAAAIELGALFDWNQTAIEIHEALSADRELAEEMALIVERWGGDVTGSPAPAGRCRELSMP